jgi:hypothetical protein
MLNMINDPQLPYNDIVLEWKDIDTDALHAEIKALLGDGWHYGLSTIEGEKIIVHIDKPIAAKGMGKVLQAYTAHDVDSLPPKVPEKSDKERIAELETMLAALLRAQSTGVESNKSHP